jgi:hypothetical protein
VWYNQVLHVLTKERQTSRREGCLNAQTGMAVRAKVVYHKPLTWSSQGVAFLIPPRGGLALSGGRSMSRFVGFAVKSRITSLRGSNNRITSMSEFHRFLCRYPTLRGGDFVVMPWFQRVVDDGRRPGSPPVPPITPSVNFDQLGITLSCVQPYPFPPSSSSFLWGSMPSSHLVWIPFDFCRGMA